MFLSHTIYKRIDAVMRICCAEVVRVNAKQIWQTTIERLRTKVQPAVFTTWFQGTSALSFQDGIFVVRVPTTFAKAHLEGRFLDLIRPLLFEITGEPVEVQFVVAKEPVDALDTETSGTNPPTSPGYKRPYRLPKGRPSSPLSETGQQQLEVAGTNGVHSAATNSLAVPAPSRPVTDRTTGNGGEQQSPSMPAPIAVPQRKQRSSSRYEQEFPPVPAAKSWQHSPLEFLPRNGEGFLNPRYMFSTFIVGKSNQFAHAASQAVADAPGRVYNPLFLYGGVGLGKTHLLHAIGHMGESAGLNVLYVTSEKFTNEMVNAIRTQKTAEFRAKYRQIDILLVDDIQFIAGKESTEEEFFHTFNSLHDASKQIVVTSDRPPKEIRSLQDRLRSRFEWGLLVDIQLPEYEHRLAILRSKADSLHFTIPASVIDYIARPECSSVREMEGALNRVIAYATLHDAPLSTSLAAKALEHMYTDTRPRSDLSVTEVLESVARYYNLDPNLLRGRQRTREVAWPRQVAMYVIREETTASLLQIGAELGGRDHTTIIHGWEKVHTEITSNDRVRHEIAAVLESLQKQ